MDAMKWEVVSYVRGLYLRPMKDFFFLVGLLHPGTGRVLIHVITARILPHLELKGREEDFFLVFGNGEVSADFAINLEKFQLL